jgi:hypothetical protein
MVLMDDLVPFLQIWRGLGQSEELFGKPCGVFRSLESLLGSSHLPVSTDKELASHDGRLVSGGIDKIDERWYDPLGRSSNT